MSKKRLLKLIYIDQEGEPYHECTVSPTTARDLIAKDAFAHLYMEKLPMPLHILSYAAVSRCRHTVCVKLSGDRKGHEILITTADQQ